MEHIQFGGLDSHSAKLGEQMARWVWNIEYKIQKMYISLYYLSGAQIMYYVPSLYVWCRLHLLNSEIEDKAKKSETFVGKSELYRHVNQFGFDITTCCGYIPQDNTWQKDWAVRFSSWLHGHVIKGFCQSDNYTYLFFSHEGTYTYFYAPHHKMA